MVLISEEAHEFLKTTYVEQVRVFFEDPLCYSGGKDIQEVFNELKDIGEELEIDLESLAQIGDMERLKDMIEFENYGIDPDDDSFCSIPERIPERSQHKWSNNFSRGWFLPEKRKANSDVEEKLQTLWKNKQQNSEPEIIGEWVTYNCEKT